MKRQIATSVAVALVLVTAQAIQGSSAAPASRGARAGTIDPADFTDPVANPYYPLIPGTTNVYRGTKDGERVSTRTTVTPRTKVIQGVTVTVVRDVARHRGHLIEKTSDWYAPDNQGNVWYFGEATATYAPDGHVISTEGSWKAGVHGAVAGIIMMANPEPPISYRQEFYRGHAEDQAWIVKRGGSITIPYGRVHRVLQTFEWTRLEPGVIDQKDYAPGLGIVLEAGRTGAPETSTLVRVVHR